MRGLHLVALAAAVLVCDAGARAAGTITTMGATLTIGAGTPQGTVTNAPDLPVGVAPAIPPVGTLGMIGTFSSQMPAFPGGGMGTDGAFSASGAVAPMGSAFDHTTYTVEVGATVTYTGNVVIRTTGDVVILGTVRTAAPNASMTFLCGGTFAMGAAGRIETTMAGSPVLVDSAVAAVLSDGARMTAQGDCEIRARGGNVNLPGATVQALAGDLTLRSSGSVRCTDNVPMGQLTASSDVLMQAFGGEVLVTVVGNFPSKFVAGTDSVRIEAALGVTITGSVDLDSDVGPVSVSAFGGDFHFRARSDCQGAFTARASGKVLIDGGRFDAGGAMTFTAFGGDVDVRPSGGNYIMQSGGQLTLEASANVMMVGAGQFSASGGVLYRALGGVVRMDQGSVLNGTGAVADIRASHQVILGTGSNRALSFRVTAGAGGFSGGLGGLTADGGPIDVTTLGPISVGGQFFTYDGDITLTSCDAGVTLPGGRLRIDDDSGPTHDVTVQSFADTAGVIDLTGGTIEIGESDAKSGDIRLRVFAGKTAGGGSGETVDSFLLPSKWITKINAKNAAKSTLNVAGVVDLGSATPDLAAAATFEVGALRIDFGAPVAKGRKLVYRTTGAVLTLTPNAKGGSRVPFALTRTGDLTGAFPLDGELDPCIRVGSFAAQGRFVLAGGKFALAKASGRLIIPCIFPQSVAATIRGGGSDTLSLSLGFVTGGTAPVGLDPCLTIGFGDTFSVDVPAASFGPQKGEKFTFKGNVGGITNVTVDHAKGVVTVKGKGLDLGAFADGANLVTITTTFGGATRTLVVRAVKTGTKLAN